MDPSQENQVRARSKKVGSKNATLDAVRKTNSTSDVFPAIPANKKNHVHSVVLGASLNIFS